MVESREDILEDKLFYHIKSLIQVKGTHKCLKRISEDIWILMSTSIKLTTGDLN